MILTRFSEPPDLRPSLDASKALLGYRVHAAFRQYFDVIGANVQRWHKSGLILNLLEPSNLLSGPERFDLQAIDLQSLTSLLGLYFYLLAGHRGLNRVLMLPYAGKLVLYLRDYDFAFTTYFGEGLASEAKKVGGLLRGLRIVTHAERHMGFGTIRHSRVAQTRNGRF